MRRVLYALAAANAAVVVALWAAGRGPDDIHDTATALAGAGRLCGLLGAYLALVLLVAVTVSSLAWARRRLRYETWYFTHLYAYLAIALAFSHQLATGTDFVGRPGARAYWTALYVVTAAALLGGRLAVPLLRAWRHRLRVVGV